MNEGELRTRRMDRIKKCSHFYCRNSVNNIGYWRSSGKNYTSPIGESPTRSATPTKIALWILTLTEGHVKLGEVDKH
ncbi:hypothetical protein H5410_050476 [Solanum commersonii]|uniref:Uncharacterized protein n=1 Tax=Solanum commersonii TaxID=4109 RepID=A0A9J5WVK2_SOLCO|nr:hypothetical protein H5410_050476 [Solanum commersonii]